MAMSVSSIEPIIDDAPRTLNRTESFKDMVLEDGDKKRIKHQLVNIKRCAIIIYILIAILSCVSIYAVTTLSHLQLTIKSLDYTFKEAQKRPFESVSASKDQLNLFKDSIKRIDMAKSDIEKLKVNVNMQINMHMG